MSDFYNYMQSIHNIKEDEYALLIDNLKSRKFKKGESIIEPGQTQKHLYFVRNGIQMYHFNTAEKINILGFSYPPNFSAIPESFFQQKPARYAITCLTDSELDYISYQNLQGLFDQSQQIERLFRKLAESVTIGLISRQIELRSTSIEERFKSFCQRSSHLLQLVPHKYIAAYLAIDPTNFSKLFNTVKF